ncbi:leukotriene C4 synthase isoform X2 [Choloepus didactylus]|uniref:leukotriene C4 synthase isoform X2 n=2 Tax=Choloepus didactylus TaxID=27675 RepID=UPI00189F6944|nr:leukotriene C4 synthase isoform X2 [Choloepus didactylus]
MREGSTSPHPRQRALFSVQPKPTSSQRESKGEATIPQTGEAGPPGEHVLCKAGARARRHLPSPLGEEGAAGSPPWSRSPPQAPCTPSSDESSRTVSHHLEKACLGPLCLPCQSLPSCPNPRPRRGRRQLCPDPGPERGKRGTCYLQPSLSHRLIRALQPAVRPPALVPGEPRHHEGRGGSPGHCHPAGGPAASLLLPAGDLGAQGLPRVAAAHHGAARVPARLPSPGELQRELPAVPRRALGRRRLLPRRCGRRGGGRGRGPEPEGSPDGRALTGTPCPPGAAALCGLIYLFARLRYFQGYARCAQQRLSPLYASARALWLLVGLAALGLLGHFLPAAPRAALLRRLRTMLPGA